MAQMAAAVGTGDLGPSHKEALVDVLLDRRVIRRRVKARPAAVSVELRLRLEELGAAAGAQVRARRFGVPVLAGKGSLGALLTQDMELHWGQVALPLRLGLLG